MKDSLIKFILSWLLGLVYTILFLGIYYITTNDMPNLLSIGLLSFIGGVFGAKTIIFLNNK